MLFNAWEFVSVDTYCRIPTCSLHKISKCEICIYFSAVVLFLESLQSTDNDSIIILYFQYRVHSNVDAMFG